MSLYGSSVECGLHCLLSLAEAPEDARPSARDLAEFQGVSPSFVAKLFTQLEKAGVVASAEGLRGGYRLARAPDRISVLDVVDAIEGEKPLFQCRDIRENCVLYGDNPPDFETRGVCAIHAVMLEAEQRMRDVLGARTLADIAVEVRGKQPAKIHRARESWFRARQSGRRSGTINQKEKSA